jgi:large subunit ribosomal protein L19
MAEEKKDANAAKPEEKKVEEPEKNEEKIETKKTSEDKVVEKKQAKEETPEPKETKVEKPAFLRDLNYFSDVRKDLPEIKPGDVLRVSYRVIEGGKERIQVFEGTVIAIKNAGITKTITVRKTSFGIAVERIFPLNSKLVQSIEVKKHSRVRRAKLYYLRNLKGKAARLRELR